MKYPMLVRFIDGVRQASRARGKTYNLPMDQAQDLIAELSLLLLRENELLAEIASLQTANQVTDIMIGGGSF
jgi:hypothetical protein